MPQDLTQQIIGNIEKFTNHYPNGNKYAQRKANFDQAAKNFDPSKIYEELLEENASKTYPILDSSVVNLIKDFLFFKVKESKTETAFYQKLYPKLSGITSPTEIDNDIVQQFVKRLLTKRPLVFYLPQDTTVSRPDTICPPDRTSPTEEYISYDEMQISALLQVSSPSLFINDGNRNNYGLVKDTIDFIPQGIIVGSVGARFERPGEMEYQHMLITEKQNIPSKGYGENANKEEKAKLAYWATFYGLEHFPSYEEAKKSNGKDTKKYIKVKQGYLNVAVYKARMRKVIESFLIEANSRATKEKPAYVHTIGLGTGAWAADMKGTLENLILEVYAEVLKESKFDNIADIDFAHFNDNAKQQVFDLKNTLNKNINVVFSNNEPSGYGENKIKEKMQNRTLVVQYAWDSGSFPGNEYWCNNLAASGDPAAACCSQIAEIQNPLINPDFTNKCMVTKGNTVEELLTVGSIKGKLDDICSKWPPEPGLLPALVSNKQTISQVDWNACFTEHDKFQFINFKDKKNLDPNYIGSITNKTDNQNPLVNLYSDQLQCPLKTLKKSEEGQPEAVVAVLAILVKQHKSTNTNPLIVTPNEFFTVQHLSTILEALKKTKLPVLFIAEPQTPEDIKQLISTYSLSLKSPVNNLSPNLAIKKP